MEGNLPVGWSSSSAPHGALRLVPRPVLRPVRQDRRTMPIRTAWSTACVRSRASSLW